MKVKDYMPSSIWDARLQLAELFYRRAATLYLRNILSVPVPSWSLRSLSEFLKFSHPRKKKFRDKNPVVCRNVFSYIQNLRFCKPLQRFCKNTRFVICLPAPYNTYLLISHPPPLLYFKLYVLRKIPRHMGKKLF